ncbi:MAG: hypothetical protein CMM47_03250 [Rhodospirillaceae bacterium]|nr:hypothetical protein [Rhodospirillaceae bacterium]
MNTDPYTLTATEALSQIEAGELSTVAWITSCQERIRQREPEIRAWAYINEQVIGDVEERIRCDGRPSIPIGVKDIIDVFGLPTMMGTDFHDPAPAVREGGSIAILRESGCVFMGKTVTTELGHRNPGPTRNPKDTRHTPGGSSSGSAAAVADYMVPICLGTQTSGSVVRPASYCGVLGYKPTYGDFDKTGILANAPSMDTLGILARSVDDIGLLRKLLLEEKVDKICDADLSALSFGVLRAPPWETADVEVRDLIEDFTRTLSASGARVADIQLDLEVSRLQVLHRLISGYEFRRSIAFERTKHLDLLSSVLRNGRLADGERVCRREYQSALQELAGLRLGLAGAFGDVDIVISPSASGVAPATLDSTGDAAFNSAWTLAGNPVITLPLFHAEASGLPIGCQFTAGVAQDDLLLAAAKKIMMLFGPPTFAA